MNQIQCSPKGRREQGQCRERGAAQRERACGTTPSAGPAPDGRLAGSCGTPPLQRQRDSTPLPQNLPNPRRQRDEESESGKETERKGAVSRGSSGSAPCGGPVGGAAPKRPTRRARAATSARGGGQSAEPMARVARSPPGTCRDGSSGLLSPLPLHGA
jgi:hypothetical protein